jgi:hypothetical protein
MTMLTVFTLTDFSHIKAATAVLIGDCASHIFFIILHADLTLENKQQIYQ